MTFVHSLEIFFCSQRKQYILEKRSFFIADVWKLTFLRSRECGGFTRNRPCTGVHWYDSISSQGE